MGNGIALYNSLGLEPSVYTANGILGDSLLWRYIRYAAKDWCVGGSGEVGCDMPAAIRAPDARLETFPLQQNGALSLSIPGKGRHVVSLMDMGGRLVKSESVQGPGKVEIPGLRRGLYWVNISGKSISRTHRIMVY